MSQKFRNVCFTIFTPTWGDNKIDMDRIKYIVYQYEKGDKTEHPHYQGYAEFYDQHRLKTVKEILGDETAHIEKRMGTQEQAIKYCQKEQGRLHGPYEFGNKNEQGKRNDLHEVSDKLKEGYKLLDIIKENTETYIKYSRGIEKAKFWLDKEKSQDIREVKTYVYYGKAGIGKSHKVYDTFKGFFKLDKDSGKEIWFDGYDGEDILWIDDFEDTWIEFTQLKQFLDKYPLRLKIKGSFTYAKWTKVIITSNENPEDWYINIKDVHRQAISRRLTYVEELQESNDVSDVSEVVG